MQKVYCMAILLTKGKISKLSFYKRKILFETITFFSEWFFKNGGHQNY